MDWPHTLNAIYCVRNNLFHGNKGSESESDYAIVSAAELPSFTLHSIETPTTLNPLGAKGIGESGTIGAVAAVRNAVCDALGTEIDTPLTSEKIWRTLTARSARDERHQ